MGYLKSKEQTITSWSVAKLPMLAPVNSAKNQGEEEDH